MKSKINKKIYDVGLIGLGNTGKEHLNYYLKRRDINKIYISDIKKIKNLKNKKLIIDNNLKKFKNSRNKKIVSISNYDKDHFKLIKKYFKNSHIFVEKPLCRTLKEINQINALAKKTKFSNLLTSNLVLRKASIFNKIIKEIANGRFGKIYYFEGDYLYGRLKKILKGWRGKDKNYSIMMGGGIHMVDLMIRFLQSYPQFVYSSSNKVVTSKEKFNFKDFIQSTFYFKSGAIGKITANFGCIHKHQHVIKVYGTKKSFIFDDQGPRIFIHRDPYEGKKIKISKKIYDGKACLLPEFFKKIKDKKNYYKQISKELNLVSTCIFAEMANLKRLKIKLI